MYEGKFPTKRYQKTIDFLKENISKDEAILDLGVQNPFTEYMTREGYDVINTKGEDLDLDVTSIKDSDRPVLTAFEILEHLVSPFSLLQESSASKLVASVPLKLWFAAAYQSKTDERDRHYHEFEDWQFDWLLEKAGWQIIKREKFTNPVKKVGFRPFLRRFTPRYYLVYAVRKTNN
ncbi:MAG: methyltransferase [Gilvibacter sp.]